MIHTVLPIRWDWLASMVSLACFTAGLSLLRQLHATQKFRLGNWLVVFSIASPMAFFFLSAYAEALFWFLTGLMAWSLERKRLGLATAADIAGIITRPYGLLLIIPAVVLMAIISLGLWSWHLNAKIW